MTARTKLSTKIDQAADLIAKPGAWTRGYYARDARGDHTKVNDPTAVCWCAEGALHRFEVNLFDSDEVLAPLLPDPFTNIVAFNDDHTTTQDDVVALLRTAAAELRKARK